jgi:hypothetical protein
MDDPYHIELVRGNTFPLGSSLIYIHKVSSRLTKSLASVFGLVKDEVALAFSELIPDKGAGEIGFTGCIAYVYYSGADWVTLPAVGTIRTVVTRASNRVFVGSPLCEYLLHSGNSSHM